MSEQYFEEEEFKGRFNGRTITRVLQQATPHWPMLAGFLFATVAVALPGTLPGTVLRFITKFSKAHKRPPFFGEAESAGHGSWLEAG